VVKETDALNFLDPLYQPVQFVTETTLSRNWRDSEKFSPFGRADLAASAALRAIRCTIVQLHGPTPCGYSHLDS
jgi:hypothetical protein